LVKLLLANGADPNAAGGEPVGAFGLVPQTSRLIAEKRGRTAIRSLEKTRHRFSDFSQFTGGGKGWIGRGCPASPAVARAAPAKAISRSSPSYLRTTLMPLTRRSTRAIPSRSKRRGKESGVTGDGGSMKLQLNAAVEIDP
jgi:hypothetical protein